MDKMSAKVTVKEGVQSSLAPSFMFPGVRIGYPQSVSGALVTLYKEYNRAFASLVSQNREWGSDYGYCHLGGEPVNWIVQIDMVGLSADFLTQAAELSEDEVVGILRPQIFEIENSWALYHILSHVIDRVDDLSVYSKRSRIMLDSLRKRYNMPVALLAVTDAKWADMRATEFGKLEGEALSDTEVFDLSGFDKFFGPEEFKAHVKASGGESQYLLFVRASDPIEKLKQPDLSVDQPLLSEREMRQVIKRFAITMNIDDPMWSVGDVRRINDTKRYMPQMGMALEINDEAGLRSASTELGEGRLRAKPAQGTFGCYGHVQGSVSEKDFRRKVRRGLRQRGSYLVQLEHSVPSTYNTVDGLEYGFIDRVFCGMAPDPQFIGGHREFLPMVSHEVKSGRLHGSSQTVYAEIAPST